MTRYPDPAELFPEVARIGSLAAALAKTATENGLSLGTVRANESSPVSSASVDSLDARRRALGVNTAALEPIWLGIGWSMGIEQLKVGWTDELLVIARAAHAWRHGTPATEIRRTVPHVRLTRLGEAAEHGPAAVVGARWDWERRHASDFGDPRRSSLIEAAWADPVLRRLYPYTSMGTLRFSTTTGFPFSPDVVCVTVDHAGTGFAVMATWNGPVVARAAAAAEAVALAVELAPPGIGPAVEGPYQYPDDDA